MVFLTMFICANSVTAAPAGDSVLIEKVKAWEVYRSPDNVIYTITRPTKQDGTSVSREKPYIMVADFDGNLQVSLHSGAKYKEGSKVDMVINLHSVDTTKIRRYSFIPREDLAWFKGDSKKEFDMFYAVKIGNKATIYSEFESGANAIDMYSLEGFIDAYAVMRKNRVKKS